MKLRTFDGEQIQGEITTDRPISQDGSPILLANDEPFSPEEAEFFLESATEKELEMLQAGGYDLADWEDKVEVNAEDEEDKEIESDDD